MASFTLTTLWYERARYLPGVLAVAFSALLIALQCGLLLGLFSITSIPIDHTHADIWMGAPQVLSVDLGEPIPEGTFARLQNQPEVERTEFFLQGFSYWSKPHGGRELCMIIGSNLRDDSLGLVDELVPDLRSKLSEPGTVVVDESDLERLGVGGVGDTAEIAGSRGARAVKIVGLTHGLKSLAGPYVFCSQTTAREHLSVMENQTTYVLAKCRNPEDAPKVVERLRTEYKDLSTFTSAEFSFRSRMHWLTKTKAGIALGYAAALGLLVGAVVTYQTLSAATKASLREYAVLQALGIPRLRMALAVMSQSFWVGLIGVALSLPAMFGFAFIAERLGLHVDLPWWLLLTAAVVTLTMALLSGLLALRALRGVDPAMLLR
jgi:putative ABC transport system permease protein